MTSRTCGPSRRATDVATSSLHFDYLIRGARIVDGTGSPWFLGSLGVRADRIAAIGDLRGASGDVTIDADGRILTPGFVDAHVHADLALLEEPTLEAALRQGVTSHVIGQDGISYAPTSDTNAAILSDYFAAVNGIPSAPVRGRSVAAFLDLFDGTVSANVAYLVPHAAVRLEAMGPDDRAPSPTELTEMQRLVTLGMRDGAVGFSTGLDYIPCRYAQTEELISLARATAAAGGVFVAHIRAYGPRVRVGLDEMVRIAREAPAPIHVSHFNVPADLGLELIDAARASGVDVTYDLYPYLAGSSTLMLWLPDDIHVGTVTTMLEYIASPEGRARVLAWFDGESGKPLDEVRFSHLTLPEHQRFLGLTPLEAAAAAEQPIGAFLHDLLVREALRPGVVAHATSWRTERDLERLMRHPAHMAGSDGIYVGARPHPRGWGTFARYLATYARDRGVLTLEDAVRRMTSFPARRFGLHGRGLLAPGMYADLALIDVDTLSDTATFDTGRSFARGVTHVLVNGRPVLWDGAITDERPGRPAGRDSDHRLHQRPLPSAPTPPRKDVSS